MVNAVTKPGRSMWKGQLKLSVINCAVALYKATGDADRVSFNMMHRATGNRLKQQYIDSVTNEVVETDARCKGYEVAKGQYILIESDELDAIRPAGDKVINLETCIRPEEVPAIFRDEPYFLIPQDRVGEELFTLIREVLASKGLAGIGKLMLRSRQRPVIVEPHNLGLMVTTLRYQAEVRSADVTFEGVRPVELNSEMLAIAGQLIERQTSSFDPSVFTDAYEQAVIELVRSKQSGTTFVAPQERESAQTFDLMAALKAGLAADDATGTVRKPAAPSREAMRKAKGKSGKGKKAA